MIAKLSAAWGVIRKNRKASIGRSLFATLVALLLFCLIYVSASFALKNFIRIGQDLYGVDYVSSNILAIWPSIIGVLVAPSIAAVVSRKATTAMFKQWDVEFIIILVICIGIGGFIASLFDSLDFYVIILNFSAMVGFFIAIPGFFQD